MRDVVVGGASEPKVVRLLDILTAVLCFSTLYYDSMLLRTPKAIPLISQRPVFLILHVFRIIHLVKAHNGHYRPGLLDSYHRSAS
jgi:hypothetical protein